MTPIQSSWKVNYPSFLNGPWRRVLYLNSGLRQVDFQCHLLPHEDVRVSGFCKQSFEDVELRAGEGGPLPPLLPGSRCGEEKEKKLSDKPKR